MKAILMIAGILATFFFLGWMSFSTTDGSASVTVDADKAKEDTSKAIEKSKEIVEEGIEKLKTPAENDSPGDAPSVHRLS